MALNVISSVPVDCIYQPRNPPSADGVNARLLAAGAAEDLTVPTGATLVRIAATCDIFVRYDGATAVVPGDVSDGSAAELLAANFGEHWRTLTGVVGGKLSVITNTVGGGIITASFYKQ